MVTSIHSLNLIEEYGDSDLKRRLVAVAGIIDGTLAPPHGKSRVLKEYMDLSSKQTIHPGRRASRQKLFAELLEAT